jgi:hypothetical protein
LLFLCAFDIDTDFVLEISKYEIPSNDHRVAKFFWKTLPSFLTDVNNRLIVDEDYDVQHDSFILSLLTKYGSNLVFFIDNFEEFLNPVLGLQVHISQFFKALSRLKNLHSIVVVGNWHILELKTLCGNTIFKSENVIEPLYWTFQQTKALLDSLPVQCEEEVIQDIHYRMNGHPLLVDFCGEMILQMGIGQNVPMKKEKWIPYAVFTLPSVVEMSSILPRIDSLVDDPPTNALLRTTLLISTPRPLGTSEAKQATKLVGLGLLRMTEDKKFTIASPFFRVLALRSIKLPVVTAVSFRKPCLLIKEDN